MRLLYTCKCNEIPINRYYDPADMDHRIICEVCHHQFNIRVDSVLNGDVTLTNTLYSPEESQAALDTAYPLALSESIPERVEKYTNMMLTHTWTIATIGKGGYLCPILFVNDRLLLGVQRLQAAVAANYTLLAATARIGD